MAHQIGEYKLVGDMVWRKLGYTKSDISIPICKIYGETDAIRVRIFNTLFDDYVPPGITQEEIDHNYSPLAHASVEPIDQAHPEGYDVREGVSEDKVSKYGTDYQYTL